MDLVAELLDAEARLQQAQLDNNVAELDRLLDERLIAVGPDGNLYTKQEDLQTHLAGQLIVTTLHPEELEHVLVGNTGVTCLLAWMEGVSAGEPFAVRMRYTRTWIRHETLGWRVLAAHLSVPG